MTASAYTATTVADMIAPYKGKIPPIEGRPTLAELLRVLKELCKCARKVKSNLGPLGYLFVALDPTNYRRYTNVVLNLLGPSPPAPTFTDAMTPGAREVARLEWQCHTMENDNITNMNECLIQIFFSPRLAKAIKNLPSPTLLDGLT